MGERETSCWTRPASIGVDVYVTSDLRHHPASEFREYDDAPALIDVPHWAAEWTWLPVARQSLSEMLGGAWLDDHIGGVARLHGSVELSCR
ncbi:MAG: Nif3-like dinuclear metal center hexameric protein [Nocardioidaceae bacterium]